MAHPIRICILEALCQREAWVRHLTNLLGQRQPYISQQLTVLREAGLVIDRREGTTVYYGMADDRVGEILALVTNILNDRGISIPFVPVPEPPLVGCGCPDCKAFEQVA